MSITQYIIIKCSIDKYKKMNGATEPSKHGCFISVSSPNALFFDCGSRIEL